jgi:hypothetical protein
MHGAKAGRLDQNIRVNFGLVGKTDSPFRQLSVSTPLHPISPSMMRGQAMGSGAV